MNSTVFPWKMMAIAASAIIILFIAGFLISGNQPVKSQQTFYRVNKAPASSALLIKDSVIADSGNKVSIKSSLVATESKTKLVAHHKKTNSFHKKNNIADTSETRATHDDGPTPLNEMLVMDITAPKKQPNSSDINEEAAHPKAGWDNFEKYLSIEAISPTGKEGTVKLTFMVSNAGNLSDFKIQNSFGVIADKKAIELVKNGPSWTGNANKQPTEVKVSINFH